jgi:protein-S-isoprenylcysteine O-methyltransferase Ste14
MSGEAKFISEEYPRSDSYQIVMLVLFVAVWVLDSFFIKIIFFGYLAPWYLRIGGGLLVVLYGVYLVDASHKLVIDADEPVLVDWGVYSIARHPMYLGILLVYLGVAMSTLSGASLLLLLGIFLVYDRFAAYEEAKMIEKMGQGYLDYQRRVHRWLPLER